MTAHTPIESRGSSIPIWALVLAGLVLLTAAGFLAANLTGENPPLAIPGASSGPVGSAAPDPAVGQALVGRPRRSAAPAMAPISADKATFPASTAWRVAP